LRHRQSKKDLLPDCGDSIGITESFEDPSATAQRNNSDSGKDYGFTPPGRRAIGEQQIGAKEFFIDRSHTLSSMSKEWIAIVRGSGRFSNHRWDDKVTVETTTLDLLIKEYGRPSFCKIDVEGFEFEVIQGLSQPVNMLSFEFIPEYPDPVLTSIEYLSKLGNAEFNYSLAESTSFALPRWNNADDMASIFLALPRDSVNFGDIYVRFADHKVQ